MGLREERLQTTVMRRYGRLARTIIHLRMEQLVYQALYRGGSVFRERTYSDATLFRNRLARRPWKAVAPFCRYRQFDGSRVGEGGFCFLNVDAEASGAVDWSAAGMGRLWRYNLHYFQYLLPQGALAPDVGLGLIRHWIACNPPGTADAWDPFPVSLRVVNWLKYLTQLEQLDSASFDEVIASAYQQVLWLEGRLERHLLANHFFKNLKALIFAGLFFEGADADRWLATGERFLMRELSEQVLPDGGHFERSPMYHCMVLEDCLDLVNAMSEQSDPRCRRLVAALEPTCRRMAQYLAGMVHPDAEIALFNDSAFGIELPAEQLLDYAAGLLGQRAVAPASRFWSFPDTGYYVLAPRGGDRMIVDCGNVGPDYQPGHAHCDTLSYELSLGGRRVIVDSGVHDYELGEMRRYVRSTAAHNTVRVDGVEQSEIWGAFRVGRRAKPLHADLEATGQGLRFSGAHEGYRRLGVTHSREITWDPEGTWTVRDQVTGSGQHRIESFVHLHPDFAVDPRGREIGIVERTSGEIVAKISVLGSAEIGTDTGWYCPEFGKNLTQSVIIVRTEGRLPLELAYSIRGVSPCTSSS